MTSEYTVSDAFVSSTKNGLFIIWSLDVLEILVDVEMVDEVYQKTPSPPHPSKNKELQDNKKIWKNLRPNAFACCFEMKNFN